MRRLVVVLALFWSVLVQADYYSIVRMTEKRKNFYPDMHVWAYSAAFAQRYGMPEEWIEPALEGAEAVAFRLQPAELESCGLKIDKKYRCARPKSCVYDLYIKSDAGLPWRLDWPVWSRSRGLSYRFLTVPEKERRVWNSEKDKFETFSPVMAPLGTSATIYNTMNKKRFSGISMFVQSYQRRILKDLDLVSLSTICGLHDKHDVEFWFSGSHKVIQRYTNERRQSIPHVVKLPKSFLTRTDQK